MTFRKILVANRGEIAVRAFRAATEFGAKTVAVFPHEDRQRAPTQGRRGLRDRRAGPPGACLPQSRRRSSTRPRKAGADAIYPGYGFLSENPDLAEACAEAGITFIGPPLRSSP
jgi:pyruvate carboxylase